MMINNQCLSVRDQRRPGPTSLVNNNNKRRLLGLHRSTFGLVMDGAAFSNKVYVDK